MNITHSNLRDTKYSLKDLLSNQHKKSGSFYRNGSPTQQSNIFINYDEFIYTDKLTKKKIVMKEALTSYQKGRQYTISKTPSNKNINIQPQKKINEGKKFKGNKKLSFEKQITNLDQCFTMLKLTSAFKMNSLREKIFANVQKMSKHTLRESLKQNQQNQLNEFKNLLLKRKKIRQVLESSVKQTNVQQFRGYYSNVDYKVNKKILAMNYKIPNNFNKNNIEKIISILENTTQQDQNIQCKVFVKDEEEIILPGEQKLRDDLIEYLKKKMKENGEYLITPQKKKLLYNRLHTDIKLNANPTKIKDYCKNKERFSQNILLKSEEQISLEHEPISLTDSSMRSSATLINEDMNSKANVVNKVQKMKKTNDNYLLSGNVKDNNKIINKKEFNSPISPFLKFFNFSNCQKSQQINKIKAKVQSTNRKLPKKYDIKQQKFLFLVQNCMMFDIQKQILMNEQYIFLKDKNENNLLHICGKNHYTQLFIFIVEKLRKASVKKQCVNEWGKKTILRQIHRKEQKQQKRH